VSDPSRGAKEAKRAKWWAETKVDLKWATALLFVLILAVSGWLWSRWNADTAGTEVLADMTDEIFSTSGLVVPFEVLSLLLLAALIAGVVIALREPEGDA
jgi:NADH:ubiquinone oxidoreductase subunit 6 (subunit J)